MHLKMFCMIISVEELEVFEEVQKNFLNGANHRSDSAVRNSVQLMIYLKNFWFTSSCSINSNKKNE